jgi:uncharacterized Tic20 family protein
MTQHRPAGTVPAARGSSPGDPVPPPAARPPQRAHEQHDEQVAASPYQPGGRDARLAMLAYLTVPMLGFGVPLFAYLRAGRKSRWLRAHASQALNVWLTGIVYDLSAAIMGTLLALDSPQVAVIVMVALLAGLWVVTLAVLIRAATRASQGGDYTVPHWLCSRIVR